MASSAQRIQTAKADFLDAALYDDEPGAGLAPITRGMLLAGLSRAFDLVEGRRAGHAQRVAYVGLALAKELRMRPARVEDVFFACLLHDAGMAVPGIEQTRTAADRGRRPTLAPAYDLITAHSQAGALLARKLGLSESVARAIELHHSDASHEVAPTDRAVLVARVVSTADRVESIIDGEAPPLWLRHRAPAMVRQMAGTQLDAQIAATMADIMERDEFWLGLYDNELGSDLMGQGYGGPVEGDDLLDLLAVISDLVDERACRPNGRGRQIAELARAAGERLNVPERRLKLIEVAALLQDLGTLGVPMEYLSKADILTVDEMAAVQMHPTFARDIVSEIPGLGAAAWWIGCHHERIDGKGYPGTLEGDEVPLEAQIIGIAEAYQALRSERPYRAAMSRADALDVLQGMSGTRFAPELLPVIRAITAPQTRRALPKTYPAAGR